MSFPELTKTILVGYHSNCTDGFTAAAVAYSKFKDTADYVYLQYNKEYNLEIFQDKEVYILDFSFSRTIIEQIYLSAKSLQVIDHHKTAQDALKGLDYCIFDMTKSGALLTYEHFNPGQPIPKFIQLISDYDLWNHHSPEVLWFNKAIRCLDFDLEVWSKLVLDIENDSYRQQFFTQGKAIDTYTKMQVSSISKLANECHIVVKDDIIKGLIVNCSTVFTSEVGNKLAIESNTFGATYVVTKEGNVLVSLRSVGDYTVNDIAKHFGGGGHNNAAGFTIPLDRIRFEGEVTIIDKAAVSVYD